MVAGLRKSLEQGKWEGKDPIGLQSFPLGRQGKPFYASFDCYAHPITHRPYRTL